MISIREMKHSDIKAVLALRLQWLSNRFDIQETTTQVREWFSRYPNNDRAFGLVAEDGDLVVGYILCALTAHPTMTGLAAEIDEVSVAEPYRRRGIGRRLVETSRQRLVSTVDELNAIRACVDREDEVARSFWLGIGFEHHTLEFIDYH